MTDDKEWLIIQSSSDFTNILQTKENRFLKMKTKIDSTNLLNVSILHIKFWHYIGNKFLHHQDER